MSTTERKNFSKEIVSEVLAEQNNLCSNCGSFLIKGFHQHHKNGNHSDVIKENCELLCSRCHRAKQAETGELQKYREMQTDAIKQFDSILQQGLEGKLSGTHIDKLSIIVTEKLKVAWRLYDFEEYPEPLPTDIRELYEMSNEDEMKKAYTNGFIEGLKRLQINVKAEDLIST